MSSILEKHCSRGQAMLETLMVAAILVGVMVTFGLVASAFLDYGYRTLRLIAMEYP